MQSKATTVSQHLAALPAERRAAISAVLEGARGAKRPARAAKGAKKTSKQA